MGGGIYHTGLLEEGNMNAHPSKEGGEV